MKLKGTRIAIVAGPEYEDLELHYPLLRLIEEGAEVKVIAPERTEYRGKRGLSIIPDLRFEEASPADFDGLVIPGGWMPDRLRRDERAVKWVRDFFISGKPVGSICHGPQILISARVIKGYRVTAVSAIKDDLENAGAVFFNEPCVRDRNLVTARVPADLPYFMSEFINLLVESQASKERTRQAIL
ncbi:MAG: type 1 glutamine amidotransferase [Aigarchaeota archaeon]|nr:type 1 glutamine amidotransferase [Aigarchaeota archaeon]MDW8093236.1 type 1 glutamine amidotransferase domain-containing protein [Nitrososphaerota archaeon]